MNLRVCVTAVENSGHLHISVCMCTCVYTHTHTHTHTCTHMPPPHTKLMLVMTDDVENGSDIFILFRGNKYCCLNRHVCLFI